jgi:hypothetical protein
LFTNATQRLRRPILDGLLWGTPQYSFSVFDPGGRRRHAAGWAGIVDSCRAVIDAVVWPLSAAVSGLDLFQQKVFQR